MRILYVEDNPLDADMLTRELARQAPQITIEHAATFAEAAAKLAICTPEQPVYDLVLTDMQLPDESGLALLPHLQQRGLNLAVVVLTGQGNDEAVVTALKAGASDYVVKRGDYLARLPAILEAALQRHQTETARRARPLRVLYAEGRVTDSVLTQQHFARHVPHLQLEIVNSAEAVLRRLPAAGRASTALGDVLLLDYHLPGLNGLELMKELLHSPGFDLPIIFVTDQNSEEIALQALRLGAMDYVVKQPDYLARLPVILENAFYRVQLNRDQAALRASEQRYRMLIENQGEGIAILDAEEGFLFANPAARSIFGVAPDDLLGRNLREFLTPTQFALVTTETRDYLRQGKKTTYELKITRPDRQQRDLLVTASPQTGPDQVFSATFSIFRDITERKQAERALQRLNVELEQRVGARTAELRDANVALAHAARLKDEFLASMSHELRTPLTGILNLAEALQEQVYGPQNEKQLKSLRTIEDSGRHLLGLINDILDLSKIEAGQLQLQIEDCAVGEICQGSLQLIKGMAQKKRQTVSFDCRSEAIYLRADARRLKQMLVNLLSNAVKFTPEDGPIGLRVEADANARIVRFTVWDTGLGIAAADLPKLFQPFTQLDGSLARQQAGTGLGLALVRRMAELHGGSVSVESAPGQGSRFIITLPWVSSSVAVPQHKRTAGLLRHTQLIGIGHAHLTDTHQAFLILLVDDNETNIRTYTDYFETKGFQVAVARQGEEAVRLAVTLQPDLILMDVQLPGMDGLEATLRIRHHPDRRVAALPIIALTALAMPGDRERCLAAGADEYLSKPVSLTVLVKTVETQLTRTYSSAIPVN